MYSTIRELRFALNDSVVVMALAIAAILACYTIWTGSEESTNERALIERVTALVTEDREFALAEQSDAGGAAYYAYHFTYQAPKALSFISRGVRDDLPWKHRIRMLALEGQIYETDTGNPELSRIGKLDFDFVAAFLLPLLSILLLYDLKAAEIRNNRWEFLSATSGNGLRLLSNRAAVRSVLLYLSIIFPFAIAAVFSDASSASIKVALTAVALNVFIWFVLALLITYKTESGPTAAALLLGIWFTTAVAIPVVGKLVIEYTIPLPKGGEILLAQREKVNAAWDLPKLDTMTPFLKQHPEWTNEATVDQPFEWKWFFAFQQVGDQTVAPLSQALHQGTSKRDEAMHLVSLTSPSLYTSRTLSQIAETDIASFQRYNRCVRRFHARLREFHYPMLFGRIAYSQEQMKLLPIFAPCERLT